MFLNQLTSRFNKSRTFLASFSRTSWVQLNWCLTDCPTTSRRISSPNSCKPLWRTREEESKRAQLERNRWFLSLMLDRWMNKLLICWRESFVKDSRAVLELIYLPKGCFKWEIKDYWKAQWSLEQHFVHCTLLLTELWKVLINKLLIKFAITLLKPVRRLRNSSSTLTCLLSTELVEQQLEDTNHYQLQTHHIYLKSPAKENIASYSIWMKLLYIISKLEAKEPSLSDQDATSS